MKKLNFLAFTLSLTLSTIPLSAPIALAEDTTTITQTTSTDTTTTSSTDTTSSATDTTTTSSINTNATTSTDTTSTTPTDTTTTSTDTTTSTSTDSLTQLINKLQTILAANSTTQTDAASTTQTDTTLVSGDTQETQVPFHGNTKNLEAAQAFLAEITATDSETMQKLELALSKTPAKNIETLAGLLDKLPAQASEKVALNIVRSMEKSIAKMEKINEVTLPAEDQTTLTEEEQAALNTLDQTLGSETLAGVVKEEKVKNQDHAASAEKHQSSGRSHEGGSKGRR